MVHTTCCATWVRASYGLLVAYPGVDGIVKLELLLAPMATDAVAIAAPVGTHGPLAAACLKTGKHVVVKKPLASTGLLEGPVHLKMRPPLRPQSITALMKSADME